MKKTILIGALALALSACSEQMKAYAILNAIHLSSNVHHLM